MTCTTPVKVYIGLDEPMAVPCGRCRSCRIHRVKEWTYRLMSELPYHKAAFFATLTYDEENCPINLCYRDVQLFWKRYRKVLNEKVKYYVCGEYGDQTGRPHYHAIIFGYWPKDAKYNNFTRDYGSQELSDCWSNGSVRFGEVTTASARYVAGYINKKLRYQGDYDGQTPPFCRMSKGIGLQHLQEHSAQYLSQLYVEIDGFMAALPRYYKKKLDIPTEVLYGKYKEQLEYIDECYRRRGLPPEKTYSDYQAKRKNKAAELEWFASHDVSRETS